MRSYETARSLYSFLTFCAWCLVVGGVIVALIGAGAASEMRSFGRSAPAAAVFMASIPGLALTLAGVLSLALVENGRAAVDTAELTQQMLKVAREQLEVSKQALRQGQHIAGSYEALDQASASAHEQPQASFSDARSVEAKPNGQDASVAEWPKTLEYAGYTLELRDDEVRCGSMTFKDLESAKRYFDKVAKASSVGVGGVTRRT